jgi:gas vesicle protein
LRRFGQRENDMSDTDHRDEGKFWFGFFLGGLLGAIILFFIGTREGKKTGKLIQERGEDLVDDLQGRLEDLKKKGKELAEQGQELKEQVMGTIEEKKENLTNDAKEKIDTALAHIEEIQERGRLVTENIRKEFKNLPKKS